MNGIIINKLISLGNLCFSSDLIKRHGYKTESYPFDWIVSNFDMIISCIDTDFTIFLDKQYHYNIWNKRPIRSGHSYYDSYVNTNIFKHHNIVDNYDYYKRCVDRFLNLYNDNLAKLFINFTHYNLEFNKVLIYEKLDIINNLLLNKNMKNFYIVYIHSFNNKDNDIQKHELEIINNIYIIKYWPISCSNGREYENQIDNDYISNVLHNLFEIKI
jgi:hypothetical protein